MNHHRFLANLGRRNTTATSEFQEEPAQPTTTKSALKSIVRRNSTQVVCQRCKKFEVDLTSTSDHLNATDSELQASRQVISLLQRQLELFRVEKEGLEKLIVAQTKGYTSRLIEEQNPDGGQPKPNQIDTIPDGCSAGDLLELGLDDQNGDSKDTVQKNLMDLIQTQLYSKDEEIVKLKFSLKEVRNEKEQLNVQLHLLEDDKAKLKSENTLLRENLALRDQTIISLSNEVFEQSGNNPKARSSTDDDWRQSGENIINQTASHSRQPTTDQHYQRQISKLSDKLEAYKKTNELLNQSVLKLTERCAQNERSEMDSKSQAQEMEARCCQIQSKLLSLLKEIEQSTSKQSQNSGEQETNQAENDEFIQSEPVKLLIKRLLEDKSLDIPPSWKQANKENQSAGLVKETRGELECDELGFYIVDADNSDDFRRNGSSNQISPVSLIVNQPQYAKIFSKSSSEGHILYVPVDLFGDSASDHKNDEPSWRLAWDEFIKDFDKVNIGKSKEFKTLLRSGVPQEYRCKIWKAMIDSRLVKEREEYGPDYYQTLLQPPRVKSADQTCKLHTNPSSKQIELDLLRTLPNNKYFESIDSPGTVRLRRVLNAFAAHHPGVGYCQGMNRLAAVAMLVLPEEEAFWCLVAIVDKIMPSGYYNDLWLAQVDSNVVMDFVGQFMPNLAEHFRRNEIELSLFAWFLTIFVDGTTPALFLRLWDCFLHEGDKVMFRVALALLKMNEHVLIQLNHSVSVNNFLRYSVNNLVDVDYVFKIAFELINPLPGHRVRSRREAHFRTMQANLNDRASKLRTTPMEPAIEVACTDADHNEEDCNPEKGPDSESTIIDV